MCACYSSVDLPRVRESKYPSLDSDSRLDPLPMAYPKAVEPVLNRLGEFPPNSLRRPVVEITAMSWYQHTVYASTACGSLLKIKTDGSVRFDDDGSTFGMFARDQVPTAITAARERLLTACAVSGQGKLSSGRAVSNTCYWHLIVVGIAFRTKMLAFCA